MTLHRNSHEVSSSVRDTLKQAHHLYTIWGGELKQAPFIDNLIEKLKQNISATKKAMAKIGVLKICKHCDEEEGGSCCGYGIELKYNSVLLLINLLLGVRLPKEKREPNSCFFLGENGCLLLSRHVLCVNYFCALIKSKLTSNELMQIQSIAGEELYTVFKLHEAIKLFISQNHYG